MTDLEEGELPFDEDQVIEPTPQTDLKPNNKFKKREKTYQKLFTQLQNNSPNRFRKRELCKFHLQNACLKGKDCTFEHDFSSILCKFYYFFGECSDKEGCKFFHGSLKSEMKIRELVDNNWDMIITHPTHYFKNSPIYQKLKTVINQKKFFLEQSKNPISFQASFISSSARPQKETKKRQITIDHLFELLRPPPEPQSGIIKFINKVYDNMFAQ